MDTPFLRIEDSGEVFPLRDEVTTVGRGQGADIRLDDPSVSRLHAELIRRGPYVYVVDLGLSRNGTRVNGRPIARRVLDEGDVLSFGAARGRGAGRFAATHPGDGGGRQILSHLRDRFKSGDDQRQSIRTQDLRGHLFL